MWHYVGTQIVKNVLKLLPSRERGSKSLRNNDWFWFWDIYNVRKQRAGRHTHGVMQNIRPFQTSRHSTLENFWHFSRHVHKVALWKAWGMNVRKAMSTSVLLILIVSSCFFMFLPLPCQAATSSWLSWHSAIGIHLYNAASQQFDCITAWPCLRQELCLWKKVDLFLFYTIHVVWTC